MAVKKKTLDRMFVLIMGVIGFILFLLAAVAFNNMPDECTAPIIYHGMTIVLVIGAVMVTLAVTYMLCNVKFGECYNQDKEGSSEIYYYIGSGLSVILTILSIAMLAQISKEDACTKDAAGQDTNNGKTLKFCIGFIMGFSILALLGCAGGSFYVSRVIPNKVFKV